jgi:hypothetical protein
MQQRVCRSAARRPVPIKAPSCDEVGAIAPGARNCEAKLERWQKFEECAESRRNIRKPADRTRAGQLDSVWYWQGLARGPARRETSMKIPTVRAGAHIEGVHWIAEYAEDVHEIRVFREGQEVDVHNAPSTLFGDEENAGSKSTADHRAVEAAVLAYLKRFVIEHDAEE